MVGTVENRMSIPQFFENKSIFITGATGFIGRILLEKLLRSCPGINKIYVLVRPKKGKTVKERLKDIIDIPLFNKIKLENGQALHKIITIGGDTQKIGLGMSDEDRRTIIENVTIIFHNAACVKFDDKLKSSILTNIRSAREVMELAKQLKNKDVFVDTSTAYCNADVLDVKEQLYPKKWNWKDIIAVAEECDERLLESLTQKLIQPLPNTYTFTKSIAEHVITDLSKGEIPTVIARPTIVITTHSDPVTGWIDNFNGPSGLLYGIGMGVTRILYGFERTHYDHVFADNVVKALIISAWKKAMSGNKDDVDIYNIASDFNFSLSTFHEFGMPFTQNNPMEQQLWPPYPRLMSSYPIFYLATLICHLLPAALLDSLLRLKGKPPILWKVQRKTFIANNTLVYFMERIWNFENKNYLGLRDSLLESDIPSFYFKHYGRNVDRQDLKKEILNFFTGCRTYLAKEGPPTEKAIRKQRRSLLIEKIWFTLLGLLCVYYLFFKWQIFLTLWNILCTYFHQL